jgi:para-aminobenzoate synthetase component I
LLPAGSISGAPKPKTIEIIKEVEKEKRGYYTGVFGYFDGKNLDSGVVIRYIEQNQDERFYRSGGGITSQSNALDEYNEVIQKIYVPVA